jgi:hypothetical protein
MKREWFLRILEEEGYLHLLEGDKIVAMSNGSMELDFIKSIPPNVEFRNKGTLYLNILESIPSGTFFNNRGDVYLNQITSIPPGVVFNNIGNIQLRSFHSLDPFNPMEWEIKGIDFSRKRLLNLMIKKGLFI